VTLQPFGDGWQDEMAMGRVVESTFRSLNNLLEKLHQSFFFYLLMQHKRFVSIGTYLPSAMLVAVNFTIMAISLWIHSGRKNKKSPEKVDTAKSKVDKSIAPYQESNVKERQLFLPMAVVGTAQFLGVIPIYLFNNSKEAVRPPPNPRYRLLLTSLADASLCFRRLFSLQRRLASGILRGNHKLFQANKPAIPTYEVLLSTAFRDVPIISSYA
jgi:hypothetical protein